MKNLSSDWLFKAANTHYFFCVHHSCQDGCTTLEYQFTWIKESQKWPLLSMAEDNPTKEHFFWSKENTSDRDTTLIFKANETSCMTWLAIPRRMFPVFSWENIVCFFAWYLREASEKDYRWHCKNVEKEGENWVSFVMKQEDPSDFPSNYECAYELFCKFEESTVVKQQKAMGRSPQQLEMIINDLESLGRMAENFRDTTCIKEAVEMLRRAYS